MLDTFGNIYFLFGQQSSKVANLTDLTKGILTASHSRNHNADVQKQQEKAASKQMFSILKTKVRFYLILFQGYHSSLIKTSNRIAYT